ncbi:MAG TPA: histidine kinase [Mycobacteriales bacterium]|nr:histidine kinase [Mycobacteriales bacterium]
MGDRKARLAAAAMGAISACLVGTAAICSVVVGWSFADAMDVFVVSNGLVGVSFGVCGAVIAWHRPRNAVGWLFGLGGLATSITAAAAPVAQALSNAEAPNWAVRLAATAFAWAWPVNIGILLPTALLLFPDGRLPGPRWRPVVWVVAGTGLLFPLLAATEPTPLRAGLPVGYGTIAAYHSLSPLWVATEVRTLLSVLVAVAALVLRYRRGEERTRRQLLWLLLAVVVMLGAITPWALVSGTPNAVLLAIPLVPIAVAIAILRHQLLDIRLVVARGVTYALVSACVLAAYAALVLVLSGVLSALLVALLVLPLRARVQTAVDRLFYGDRGDPLRVATRLSDALGSGLHEVVDDLRLSLRLPSLSLVSRGLRVESGGAAERVEAIDLDGTTLLVGLRTGESALSTADERVLRLVAGPLAVAARATRLSTEVQASRERIVVAREEERRRLRRDLHDGLGPLLTGVAYGADAAANLLRSKPDNASELLAGIRGDTRTAVTEVRRIIDDLRPAALDELGLVEALRERSLQLGWRADGTPLRVQVEAAELPELPAAVEVAAYRIATEALNNAVRHSQASEVRVRLSCRHAALEVEVADDGVVTHDWAPGVGTTAMRERASEVGGSCEVGPTDSGWRVHVRLPVGVS